MSKEKFNPKKDSDELLDFLRRLKPKTAPAHSALRDWWDKEALPTLQAQMLSEFHRYDGFKPRIIGFMKDNTMGVVDVMSATGGKFGDRRSKDATAFVHYIAALVPGTRASVFCSEVWSLKNMADRELDKYPSLGDHPDRQENIMLNMMSYDIHDNTIMQLTTMVEILKVLGEPRHEGMWEGTKFSNEVKTTDPLFGEGRMEGRFIYSGQEWTDEPG